MILVDLSALAWAIVIWLLYGLGLYWLIHFLDR